MAIEAKKVKVLNLRVTAAQHRAYQRAAALEGGTVSSLVTKAADERAQEVLRAEETMTVSAEAFDRLLELLDGPPRPLPTRMTEALQTVLTRVEQR